MKSKFVTRPVRPSLLRLLSGFSAIVARNVFTNDGPLVQRLEMKLEQALGVNHVVLMSNGTAPLMFLASTLPKRSRILTTPFTFVATSSSFASLGHEVNFVDLIPGSVNVNLTELEKKLRSESYSAIVLTHVFGIPCDIEELERIGREYSIPIYFDAAHAFGVSYNGLPIGSFGDASTISFHATKIFSTGEGGALLTNDPQIANAAVAWRNFGINQGNLVGLGINAKMSELSGALGLANLPKLKKEMARRKMLWGAYKKYLSGSEILFFDSPNYSYFPIALKNEIAVIKVLDELKKSSIFPRRYFFPSLNTLSFLQESKDSNMPSFPNAQLLSSRIICLPSGTDIQVATARKIARIIRTTLAECD